jgi:uncharacterized protein with NAD-binding domain and iron-sulfur cluster
MAVRKADGEKAAVLGGGVSAMITAFELTNTAEMRDRFDVTAYETGRI